MIGLVIEWQAEAVNPVAARRFTASLCAGLARPVIRQNVGRATFAGVSLVARDTRRWRTVPVAGGGSLAFTGFIANLGDLRRELALPLADAAELYAAGYARWGDRVDLQAIGEFATIIAFVDERRVRAARSPILAPPLHLCHDDRRAVIASAPRAALAAADLPMEIDEQKIADSLYLNYTDRERGWYRHVQRLDVGTRAWLFPGSLRTERYYDLIEAPSVRLKRDEDYVAAANELLAEGTRLALAGVDRPAICLSGGLDSQAVAACVMAERPDQRLLGLTSIPEPGLAAIDHPRVFEDERHHVAALAGMYPMLDSETIDAAGRSIDHKLSAMFLLGGIVPRNVLNFPWLHSLYERARAADCDVVLKGSMGNLGFSFDGGGALPSWLLTGCWIRLASELSARNMDRGFLRSAARDAVLPLLPPSLRSRLARSAPRDPDWCAIQQDYARTTQARERWEAATDTVWPNTRAKRRAMLLGAGNEAGDVRQGFAAIHGLPTRDPTGYRPLLEFCMGLPDDQYLRNGQPRWLARRMLRGRISDLVVDEPRRGRQAADAPVKFGRMHTALTGELDALARDPAMAARFDLARLRTALTDWTPGTRFSAGQNAMLRLALPRVLATARFIRYVEGGND